VNHYIEAVVIGVLASSVLFVAGVGAGSPSKAATPATLPADATGPAAEYESAFYKARAQLAKAQWRYEFAVADRARTANRVAAHHASREDLDVSIAAVERADATVKADRSALALAQAHLARLGVEPLPIS
jgi:multidrug resistance efflux pump